MSKREDIKELYTSGKSIEEICACCAISRGTFYYHKKSDQKNGINWELLRLQNNRSSENIEEKEARFLNLLIESFDKFIEANEELDQKTIEALHKYATTYWRLKAPKELDAKSLSIKAVQEMLKKIGELALKEDNKEVVNFLAKHADYLIAEILKNRG